VQLINDLILYKRQGGQPTTKGQGANLEKEDSDIPQARAGRSHGAVDIGAD
jgi:hypothetical protein